MVEVAGRPLIDHALDRFRAAGIGKVTVVINEVSDDCRRWLEHHAGDFELDMVVRSTPSSYATFRLVAGRLAHAPAIITTVDSVMQPTIVFSPSCRASVTIRRPGVNPPHLVSLTLTPWKYPTQRLTSASQMQRVWKQYRQDGRGNCSRNKAGTEDWTFEGGAVGGKLSCYNRTRVGSEQSIPWLIWTEPRNTAIVVINLPRRQKNAFSRLRTWWAALPTLDLGS